MSPVALRSTRIQPSALSESLGQHSQLRAWLARHRSDLVWMAPTLALVLAIQAANISGTPQRTDDEGTYVAQAWAILQWGELAHYTYWYDHPPLGWIQIAGYAWITGAFERWGMAVMAGREAMLVAFAISAFLVWVLARRLLLSRPASAVAVALFALSPLAVTFHRTVYLDNIAIPWLLGAFILATSRHKQLMGFAGAAVCVGIAVLTKETFLLALPFVAWTMWRHSDSRTRKYTLVVAVCALILIGSSYVLLAALKGEVLPGSKRVSLVEGIGFQLVSRGSGGWILEPESVNNNTFMMWWQRDPVILLAAAGAALVALFLRKVRPLAVMLAFLLLIVFRPSGYLPIPYVIILFPFAALLLAYLGDRVTQRLLNRGTRHHFMSAAGALCLTGALVITLPQWSAGLANVAQQETDRPTVDAQQWVLANVPRNNRLIVDDTMWVDMVRAGFDRENVLWFYKLDTDPSVQANSPNGWKDSDYIISTAAMRAAVLSEVGSALTNSEPVAVFGGIQDGLRVEVRRIYPEGIDARRQQVEATRAVNAKLGAALAAAGPRLQLAPEVRAAFDTGSLDPRILLALRQKLTTSTLAVTSLPVVSGEEGVPPHQFLVSYIDGIPTAPGTHAAEAVRGWAADLRAPLQVSGIQQTQEGVLISFPLPAPEYIQAK